MAIFEDLYDLSIRLLTAPPKSELGRLTLHHCRSNAEAEALVRAAVLTREMPGEVATTRWGILRVFMRNLVNRSQPAMAAQAMLHCLDDVSLLAQDEASRTAALVNAVAGNAQLSHSLQAALSGNRAPDGCNDYLDWLSARIGEYGQMPVAEINADRVLSQLHHIASDHRTKIPNMGIALASNLFADLGIRVVGKPDLHVLPTVKELLGDSALTPDECIREVIRISQEDAPLVAASGRFNWLTGGLYPRDIDRMMYLIGSDNFRLNGTQQKRGAPRRRVLMLNALIDASRAVGHQLGNTPAALRALPAEQSKNGSAGVDVQQTPTLPAQINLPAAGDAPRRSARELFFSSIERMTAANALVSRVIAVCDVHHVRHHHTYTNGGDLRVEPDRLTPHPRQQNVVTMAWVPTKGCFFCQVLLPPNGCIEQGMPPDGVRPNTAPLSSRLTVRPGVDDEAFLSIVDLSVQRFRGL